MSTSPPLGAAIDWQDEARAAAARIGPWVRTTPLWALAPSALGLEGDWRLELKLEQLQVSGSFKARGLFNRLLAHRDAARARGAAIASGGNAGIAAALAARALGVPVVVFVPATAPSAKRARLAALGAEVRAVGREYAEAAAACAAHLQHSGALALHAYDQVEVIAGAATLAAEIDRQRGGRRPDRVLVSVGGGGLAAGLAAGWLGHGTRLDALEPAGAPTLHAARAAGRPVDVEVGGLAADALGARRIGALAWPLLRGDAVTSRLVADDAIRAAQRALWQQLRLAVEPAAALPLAALASGVVRPAGGETVVAIVCGANCDLHELAQAAADGGGS